MLAAYLGHAALMLPAAISLSASSNSCTALALAAGSCAAATETQRNAAQPTALPAVPRLTLRILQTTSHTRWFRSSSWRRRWLRHRCRRERCCGRLRAGGVLHRGLDGGARRLPHPRNGTSDRCCRDRGG